jgi:hypothetical protein
MNKFVAESVLIRMRLSLLRWGIKGDLLSKLAVTHGNPKISGVTGKSVIIAYPITIHMPFYGAYLDAGRGGAKRAGYLNPATGNSEFYDALYVWAEKTLAVDDAHLDAVVIRIYDNINTYGGGFTKPRMFLIGSLNYIAAHETIDARFEESIEPYLEKNLNRELKGLKP